MKRNLWPISIVGFFAVAIAGAVAFVVFCNLHPTDLVAADYYEQEVRYQQEMERVQRTQRLTEPANVSIIPEQTLIRVSVPAAHAGADLNLARLDARKAHAWLGDWGVAMARLARGEDMRDVESYRDAVSMGEENTFASDVEDRAVLEAAILAHADSVARRLRKSAERGRTVVLKLKLARRVAAGPRGYPLVTRRTTLPVPTDDGDVIARSARELLRSSGLAEPVRLLGVGVTNLEPANPEQLALGAEGAARTRRASLNRALDEPT